MNIAIAVLIGCILSFGQEATSSTAIDNEVTGPLEDSSESGYVPVPPGSKIYFYAVRNGKLLVGPKLKSRDEVTIYTVKRNEEPASIANEAAGKYAVLKSGVLVPKTDTKGQPCNENIYKSRKPTFYIKGFKDILIPINLIYSKSKQKAVIDTEALVLKRLAENENAPEKKVEKVPEEGTLVKATKEAKMVQEMFSMLPSKPDLTVKPKEPSDLDLSGLAPDRNCNGEITMFILKSDGVFQRMPPDPYLPVGIQLSYTMKDSFLIRPSTLENANDLIVNYLTSKNGDLVPHGNNIFKMKAKEGELVSFILGECGSLIPVREERGRGKHINYYYNGQLIFKGDQFPQIFSNSEFIMFNDEKRKIPGKGGELHEKKHSIRKRSLYSEEYIVNQPNRFYAPEGHSFQQRRSMIKPSPQNVLRRTNMAPPLQHTAISHSPHPPHPPHPPVPPLLPLPPHTHRPPHTSHPPPEFVAHAQPAEFVSHPPPSDFVAHHHLSPEFIPHHGSPSVIHHHHPVEPLEPVFEPQFGSPPPPVSSSEIHVPRLHAKDFATEVESPEWNYRAPSRLRVRTDLYAEDDKGVRIPLIPEITEHDDVVLYKLTCKGYLVRYPSCKEPEFGFEIHFQLLLDEFILVPITKPNRPNHITYVLQENGDLIPLEGNEVTFKKAPGSLLYFMLGKNNVLFPIQQKVYPDGGLSLYYQDYHLLKLPNTTNKPLHFSTLSRPLYAFFNGITVMTISSRPRLNPSRGSNWKNHNRSECSNDAMAKDVFLSGPSGQLIKVSPFKTKTGSTVIYELDCNGILYRSPKDKKKCIILKSYIVLKEGILLPSNETSGYMYMTSKNGDMFPYLYPNGKLEAPRGESVKYLLCEKGILLPMEIEIVDDHICYFFRDVIIYREKVFCKNTLATLSDSAFKLHYRDDCDNQGRWREKVCRTTVIKPFTNEEGEVVYYRKVDNVLKRNPPNEVPAYLTYTMGSFEIQRDGSLYQTKFQDPDGDIVNLMLEPNGDLMEDNRNEMQLNHSYYVLDVNGNLISVEGRKSKKMIYFFKDRMKVCNAKLPDSQPITRDLFRPESNSTPSGRDPMKLLEDPEPKRSDNETDGPHSMFIPVPLKSVAIPCPHSKDQSDKLKCDSIKETMALELEINDEVIEEIKNWATKCDKLLSRREVEQSLTEVLQGVNVAGLLKDEVEAR